MGKEKSKLLNLTDKFRINDNFEHKMQRIKIMPSLVSKGKGGEDADGRRETNKKIEEDRRYEIEAAIVRIMKARKKITHNELISEAIQQLQRRFQPQPAVIKQKIEALIEREYISRSANNREEYEYVA